MLRTDGERKQQLLKQADRDRRSLNKQHQEMQLRLDQANARLVQLTDENNGLKKGSEDPEKARLRAQNDRLQALCRSLRQESKGPKPEAELGTALSSDDLTVAPESTSPSKKLSDSIADVHDSVDEASAPEAADGVDCKVASPTTSQAPDDASSAE